MSSRVDEQQQIQFELEGLKRTLEWTEIQQEQLLDRLDLLRIENTRLQGRVEELERQVEGLSSNSRYSSRMLKRGAGWPGRSPCSRNARSQKALVGRAQLGSSRPPLIR